MIYQIAVDKDEVALLLRLAERAEYVNYISEAKEVLPGSSLRWFDIEVLSESTLFTFGMLVGQIKTIEEEKDMPF